MILGSLVALQVVLFELPSPFPSYRANLPKVCADIPCYIDPFAEADEDTGETKQSQNYIHIRIQRKCSL